ncbi:hypothetical protein SAMN02745157_2822 [Kaistia soli DSM 19436]|uniref:Uncharacterized protein n=1 Tax=Kaistia soli DSM 19436 TaxID=1122133 RepID=A0A1M5DX23_9HYPH|nr:hypothetical protein [Kaistia soli]SHF71480.1 hypothetical protein SAMN02745157_2822 [Kaistia soli DSM 19436]
MTTENNDALYHAIADEIFDSALRTVEREYERNNDSDLYQLLLHMGRAKHIGGARLLAPIDYNFLVRFMQILCDVADRPYVQALLDELLDAPLVNENGESPDEPSE